MSALLTHASAGLLYGLFAWAVAGRDAAQNQWWHPVAIFAMLEAAALLPDADLLVGTHRQTFHNVWFILIIPAATATFLFLHPALTNHWVQPAIHWLPGAIGSELWYDLFAPSLSGYTEIFWPLSGAGYERTQQEVLYIAGKPIFDSGTLLGFLILYYLALGLFHRALIRTLSPWEQHRAIDWAGAAAGRLIKAALGGVAGVPGAVRLDIPDRWRHRLQDRHLHVTGVALLHVSLAVLPILYVLLTGQLVRVSI